MSIATHANTNSDGIQQHEPGQCVRCKKVTSGKYRHACDECIDKQQRCGRCNEIIDDDRMDGPVEEQIEFNLPRNFCFPCKSQYETPCARCRKMFFHPIYEICHACIEAEFIRERDDSYDDDSYNDDDCNSIFRIPFICIHCKKHFIRIDTPDLHEDEEVSMEFRSTIKDWSLNVCDPCVFLQPKCTKCHERIWDTKIFHEIYNGQYVEQCCDECNKQKRQDQHGPRQCVRCKKVASDKSKYACDSCIDEQNRCIQCDRILNTSSILLETDIEFGRPRNKCEKCKAEQAQQAQHSSEQESGHCVRCEKVIFGEYDACHDCICEQMRCMRCNEDANDLYFLADIEIKHGNQRRFCKSCKVITIKK